MKNILSFFLEQNQMFYIKTFIIIFIVVIRLIILFKIISIISNKRQSSKFEKKQQKIKRNKQNVAELNKRFGISGRISSAAFTENIDIEDIKENNNVDLRIKRVSIKDLKKNTNRKE